MFLQPSAPQVPPWGRPHCTAEPSSALLPPQHLFLMVGLRTPTLGPAPPWAQAVTRNTQAPEGTRSSALPAHSCSHRRALPSHSPGDRAVEVFEPSWRISQNSIRSCGNAAGKYSRQTLVISVLFSVIYSHTSDFLPIQNKTPTF